MHDNHENLNLSKLKPCHQYWNQMETTSQGRRCSKCSNIIYDFRKKSKAEIAFIHANTEGNVCGLYSKNHIPSSEAGKRSLSKNFLLKPTFYGLLALFVNQKTNAKPIDEQVKIESLYEVHPYDTSHSISRKEAITKQDSATITGKVTVQDKEDTISIKGINVLIAETKFGTNTDVDGNYSLIIPKQVVNADSVTVLFTFIGYASKKVRIDNKSQELNIVLSPDQTQISEFYIYEKPPFHKRIWFWITKPFRD